MTEWKKARDAERGAVDQQLGEDGKANGTATYGESGADADGAENVSVAHLLLTRMTRRVLNVLV